MKDDIRFALELLLCCLLAGAVITGIWFGVWAVAGVVR